MSKIIFAVPPIRMDEIWGELASEGSVLPPLGISILAAVTRSNGYDTKIMDFLAEGTGLDGALEKITRERPDYVGITATTDTLNAAVAFASKIKERDSGIITLIGGAHLSAMPVETMEKFSCFDYGFVGESEDTILGFLNAFGSKRDLSQIKGLVIRKDGKSIYTGAQQPITDMDRIPFPAWDLLPDIRKYYKPAMINYKREPTTSLVTSRGCAGQCIFCDASVFGRRVRAYSSDYVIKAIETLMKNYGIREVCFYDDTFVAFKKRLSEICNFIIDKKLDISWSCNARVNLVDPDMLKLMRRAGCWQIAYGIESGSQRVLDTLKKGIKIEQIRNAIKWTKEAGISTKGFFMIGSPGETREDIDMTRRLMMGIELDDVLVEYFTPYPGAEVYNKISDYGTFKPRFGKSSTFSMNFVPYGLTAEYLEEQFKGFYKSFYMRPRIILNYIARLGSIKKMWLLLLKFIKFSSKK